MRRTRFQKGSVRPRKHGRHKVWVGQWWEDERRSKVLRRVSEIPKSETENIMTQILRPQNENAGHAEQPKFTFRQYVTEVFLPAYRLKWKASTRSTSEPDIIRHLIPAFGTKLLTAIRRE